MKPESLFQYINIDEYSATPKYLQLTNSIIKAIELGKIAKNFLLPSINEISFHFDLARDTAERGYRHLKKIGVITSVPGKGYYVSNIDFKQKLKVFLLFNKLSLHKKIIYDSLVVALGEDVAIDLYIYNNEFHLFKKLLLNKRDDYTHFVIIPHFYYGGEHVSDIINSIPKEKLILLDKKIPGVEGNYGAVYENFEKDIYNALKQALQDLSKYHTIKLIFPAQSYFPAEIINGFRRFCQQYAFTCQVVENITSEPLSIGEVYINLSEDDLVVLLERLTSQHLTIGSDVGVISYNETPLKKILLNGITTISTDFDYMGKVAAAMILGNSNTHVEIPFYYRKRYSL